jgi:hypothetical protein
MRFLRNIFSLLEAMLLLLIVTSDVFEQLDAL